MSSLARIGDRATCPGTIPGPRPPRPALTAAVALLCCGLWGCNQSYIVLDIFAGCPVLPCTIPVEADALDLTIFAAPASSDTPVTELTELGAAAIELVDGDSFPYEVLMRPSTTTPQRLRNVVNLRLGETVIGTTIAEHDWREGSVTRARITVTVPGR